MDELPDSVLDLIRIPKEERSEKKENLNEKKRRKKKLKHFFHFLGGGDSPLEAMELALGRNEKLQCRQYYVIRDLAQSMDASVIARELGYPEAKLLIRFLIKCDILPFLIRLLNLNPIDCLTTSGYSWRMVRYFATASLKHCARDAESAEDLQEIMKTYTIEILLSNAFSDDVFMAFQSLYTMAHLCTKMREATERMVFAGHIRKLGEIVYKDNCHKTYLDVLHAGFDRFSLSLLSDSCVSREVYYSTIRVQGAPKHLRHEINVYLNMSHEHRRNAAFILYKIADANDRHRQLILQDSTTFKALYKWFKAPVITSSDLEMFDQCTLTMGSLCLNEDMINTLFENHKFLKFVKIGIYLTEVKTLYKILDIVVRICQFSRIGRLRLAQDKNVVQVLLQYLFSFNDKIQAFAFQAFSFMAKTPDTAKFLYTYGLRPEHIYTLEKFYDSQYLNNIGNLRRDLHRNCSRDWKCTVRDIESESYFENFNHERALFLKSNGNEFFKKENYLDAVMAYSSAIDHAPPVLPKGTVILNAKTVFRKYDTKSWHVPAVLYSNRAQCFLKMKNWEKALDDCNEALARCLEENKESEQLLLKTPFRRAKAFMELGEYHKALNDVCVCLRRDKDNKVIQTLFKEIIYKYRQHGGSELIRRCGYCWGGEGAKLKRCANCKEVYCNRECQSLDWEVHQSFCTESNIEQQ